MKKEIKKGDLVRYRKNPATRPPFVIPFEENPVGIVFDIIDRLIGDDPDGQCILKLALVKWSTSKWNNTGGLSEEHIGDLELIQRIRFEK
jgi:hypothetical protein